MAMGARPYGGKQPRSARGAAAVLACGPTKKSGKVRRAAKHASPEKRLYGGRATTPVGLAASVDRQELQAKSGALSVRESTIKRAGGVCYVEQTTPFDFLTRKTG